MDMIRPFPSGDDRTRDDRTRDERTREDRTRRRRRGLLALLLMTSVSTLGAGVMSLAIFTSSDASTWTMDTGTIILDSSPVSMTSTAVDWLPGDSEVKALTISNTGTGDLRYAMSAAGTGTLGTTLTVEVRAQVAGSCASFTGTVVLAETVMPTGFGSSATGAQAGDRNLLAAASETLCFRLKLPLSAGNTVQNATSTATFTFDAEQTKNNP
jgi:hypothetical protein